MDMTSLLISLVSGAVGGNAAGKVLKNFDMGTLWNSVAGIVGGGLGGQIMGQLGIDPGSATGGGDLASIVSQIAGGGVGGAVLLVVAGYLKRMMSKA